MMYLAALHLLNKTSVPQTPATSDTLKHALTLTFITLGAIAMLMTVIAGLQYIFARESAEGVVKARNRIFYSLLGLLISLSGATIVNLVIGRLK